MWYRDFYLEICLWSLCFCYRAPKTLRISQVMKEIKAFFYISVCWLLGSTQRWGLVARRMNHLTGGLDLVVPSPWPQEKGEGLEVESIVSGQWFKQSYLCNEACVNIQKDWVWRVSGLVSTWISERVVCLERVWKLCAPFPLTLPCASLPAGSSWVVSFDRKAEI